MLSSNTGSQALFQYINGREKGKFRNIVSFFPPFADPAGIHL